MFPLTLFGKHQGSLCFPWDLTISVSTYFFKKRVSVGEVYKKERTTFTNLEALFTLFSFSNNNTPCSYSEDVFLAPAKLRSSDKCPSCFKGGMFASIHIK